MTPSIAAAAADVVVDVIVDVIVACYFTVNTTPDAICL